MRLSVMLTELFVALAFTAAALAGAMSWPVWIAPDAALVRAVLRRLRLGLCGGASRYLVGRGCSRMTAKHDESRRPDSPRLRLPYDVIRDWTSAWPASTRSAGTPRPAP